MEHTSAAVTREEVGASEDVDDESHGGLVTRGRHGHRHRRS